MWNDPTPLTRKEYFHYFSACAGTMLIQFLVMSVANSFGYAISTVTLSKFAIIFMLLFMYGAYNNYGVKRKKEI